MLGGSTSSNDSDRSGSIRIEGSDPEIARINTRAKPSGAAHIDGAEEVARGLSGFIDGVTNVPRLTRDLRLPAFEYSGNEDYAWPRLR